MKKTLFVEKGPDTYKVYVQVNAIQQDETLGEYYISKEYYERNIRNYHEALLYHIPSSSQ